jgi:hypothetical protein
MFENAIRDLPDDLGSARGFSASAVEASPRRPFFWLILAKWVGYAPCTRAWRSHDLGSARP